MSLRTYRTTIAMLGDFAILWASLAITLLIRYGSSSFSGIFYLHAYPFTIIFLLWVVALYISGAYEITILNNRRSTLRALLYGITAGGVISIALFYFVSVFIITPKINLALTILLSSLLLFIWRSFFGRIISFSSKIRVLLIGTSPDIEELKAKLATYPQIGYRIVAHHDKPGHEVTNLLKTNQVDLVVATRDQSNGEIIQDMHGALSRGVRFMDITQFYEIVMGKIPVTLISKLWFLENLSESQKNFFEFLKRVIDILFALVFGFFTILLVPFVALIIKLDSRGPVFLGQKRVGKMGKIYTHYKFRTMFALNKEGHAELHGAVWSQKDDKRITRTGKILRATRIDELPQLWNVLKGELSLVGPRPERPELVEELRKAIPFYDMRHLVRPGLSGWAQINPPYYYSSTKDTVLKLQYDLFYIKNRDFGLYIAIALKTLAVILSRQGR